MGLPFICFLPGRVLRVNESPLVGNESVAPVAAGYYV